MLICHCWTILLFGYQEIARTRRKWKLVCLPRKYKKGKKKNRVNKIKKKFCLVKKIVRKLNEKGIGREKKSNFESSCGQWFWQAAYYLILNLPIVQTISCVSIFR